MKINKTSFNTPSTDKGIILMNARRKEKQLALKHGHIPITESDFVSRADHMKNWFRSHPETWNFLTYGDQHGFSWSQFKRWRKKSDYFSEAIEICLQICLKQREAYLHNEGKLSAVFIREQPVYNPMLGDYETEKAKQENSVLEKYQAIAVKQYVPLEQSIKEKQ